MLVALAGLASFHLGRTRTTSRMAREIESARSELARRVSEMLSLQELSYLLSESLEPDRIIEHVVRYVSQALDSAGTMVGLDEVVRART